MDPRLANPASGSLRPDPYSGGAAGSGHLGRHTAPSAESVTQTVSPLSAEIPENHVCLHPGCQNFNWPNEVLLDHHIKTEHKEHMIETHFATEWTAAATASLESHQGSQGCQTAYGSSYSTAMINNDNFVHWAPDASSDSESSPSTTPSKPFACSHEGCPSTFERRGDLNRHLKKHRDGPRQFDCFADGCTRKGNNGFTRLDKLREHVANRHPLTDFNIYIKETGWRWMPNKPQFLCWRKARQDWQAENPSDEMPPWLLTNPKWRWLSCPKCPTEFYTVSSGLADLKDHWQTKHSSVEMPLWMSKENLPKWRWC